MIWTVKIHRKADKQIASLSRKKEDKQIITVEIIYVGTHENAPY